MSFADFPTPTLPLTGNEIIMLAQFNNGVEGTFSALISQVLSTALLTQLLGQPAVLGAALLTLAPTLPTSSSQLVYGTPSIWLNGGQFAYYPGT